MMKHNFENIGWTVGNYCNARCGHCYSWKVRRSSEEYLTEQDIDRVIDQLVRLGIKTVNLGGNEPIYTNGRSIRDTKLPYIIRRLSSEGIPVGLTTNGVSFVYLDKHFPEELKMINDIDFSLDSPFEAEHDINREGGRLYQLVVKAVARSLELGIDCSIIACGMRSNFNKDYLSAFLALSNMLGCEFRINTLKPIEEELIPDMPTPEQFFRGFEFLMNNSNCVTLGESCLSALTEAGTYGCPCGTSSFRINAKTKDGRIPINPCVYMHEFKTGDLLSEDILDIIESDEFRQFSERRTHFPDACKDADCGYLESCRGGCAARTYFTTGSLNQKDPYCPADYLNQFDRPALPHKPEIGCSHGIRVHDNYLCTWIGEAHPEFSDSRYQTIDDLMKDTSKNNQYISGCRQLGEENNQQNSSVVRVNFTAK